MTELLKKSFLLITINFSFYLMYYIFDGYFVVFQTYCSSGMPGMPGGCWVILMRPDLTLFSSRLQDLALTWVTHTGH
jgi:hypothetical protein